MVGGAVTAHCVGVRHSGATVMHSCLEMIARQLMVKPQV